MKTKLAVLLVALAAISGSLFGQAPLGGYGPSGGSSSSPSSIAPTMGVYWANSCNTVNTNQCVYAFADTLQFNDCNWTNAAVDLFCTGSHFTATDAVVKNIMGAQSFADDNQGAGSGGQIATTTAVTIATFISPTHVTLSATPANSCAANCSIYFGHLDDASAAVVDTILQASNVCQKLFSGSSNYYVTKPFLKVDPPACAAQGPGVGTFGTTTLPAGFEWEGRGVGPTTIVHDTSFPGGDPCTTKASSGQANGGCWNVNLMGKWTDIRFDGGNQPTAPNLSGKNLITMAVGTLMNFTCTNIGWNSGTVTGINAGILSQLYQVNNAGCGGLGLFVESGGGHVVAYRTVIENSIGNALRIGSASSGGVTSFTCYWCLFAMPKAGTTNTQVILNQGGSIRLYGGVVQPSNGFGAVTSGITGYKATAAGSAAYFDGVHFLFTSAVGGSGNNAIWLNATGTTATLANTILDVTTGTSNAFSDFGSTSGTKLLSLGGNTFNGIAAISAGMSVNFAPTDNLTGLTTFSPTCAATTGGTACSILAGGTNEKGTMRITASAVATGTVTLTFLGTFSGPTGAAPRCNVGYVNGGGTGSWSLTATTPVVQTVRSTTVPVFNWNQTGALTATSTYDLDYVCVAM